jgi:hypothetical protein
MVTKKSRNQRIQKKKSKIGGVHLVCPPDKGNSFYCGDKSKKNYGKCVKNPSQGFLNVKKNRKFYSMGELMLRDPDNLGDYVPYDLCDGVDDAVYDSLYRGTVLANTPKTSYVVDNQSVQLNQYTNDEEKPIQQLWSSTTPMGVPPGVKPYQGIHCIISLPYHVWDQMTNITFYNILTDVFEQKMGRKPKGFTAFSNKSTFNYDQKFVGFNMWFRSTFYKYNGNTFVETLGSSQHHENVPIVIVTEISDHDDSMIAYVKPGPAVPPTSQAIRLRESRPNFWIIDHDDDINDDIQ